ncbi:plasmid mobilization protein [[Eubacterium] hominis]|uniref:plasmid mobilization protein n=1 Tax=[Eubacterium] hominis TaxID=2764325 RepID=UPI003A4D7AED
MRTHRTRTHRIELALNDEEYERFLSSVHLCGMTQQAYLYNLVQNRLPRPKPTQDFIEMINQLRKIGNNLNQLVMIANKTGSIDIVRYKKDIEKLNKSILQIREQIYLPKECKDGND